MNQNSNFIKLPTLISYAEEVDMWITEAVNDETIINMWYGSEKDHAESKEPYLYLLPCRFALSYIESYYPSRIEGVSYLSSVGDGKAMIGLGCEQLDEVLNA